MRPRASAMRGLRPEARRPKRLEEMVGALRARERGLREDARGQRREHPLLLAAEALRRQHDDGDVLRRRILLEPREHLEAAHLGHDEVEDDGMGAVLARLRQPRRAPRRLMYGD